VPAEFSNAINRQLRFVGHVVRKGKLQCDRIKVHLTINCCYISVKSTLSCVSAKPSVLVGLF